MIKTMNRKTLQIIALGFLALLLKVDVASAQENTYQSVLSEHTWHRLSVSQEGVHKLDYATLQAMGIDMNTLNPNQIRLFGNPSGALPEKNADARPDDLTEMAIWVEGAEDGVFDAEDVVYFYGQEPTRWVMKDESKYTYQRERNPYSDSTYYYLCVDSGVEGLRVGAKATLPWEEATAVIAEFPDFIWYDEELLSPYSSGQNWLGELLTSEHPEMSISVVFPNLVKTKPLLMKSQVLGRAALRYDLWMNDNHFEGLITRPGKDYYGKLSYMEKQLFLESDTVNVLYGIDPEADVSMHLDYIEIYGWRQLKREGGNFLFRLMPSQFGDNVSAVWVQNTSDEYLLWDVSNPLAPMLQENVLSGGNLVFATNEVAEKRYVLFKPEAALPVNGWTNIPNQNVHAAADADMLIITSPVFMAQAQALADYHAEKDGMQSLVVDVTEIYNEFSTGTPDPTGIRDFIRMVYRRSAGKLKYLTLFGRSSFDFRNILGYGKNFVPVYQTATEAPYSKVDFCTDDYYGMMDSNEGLNSAGYVDLGIGRIPVSTPQEAEIVLEKIKHYDNLAEIKGDWKTNLLFMADDEVTAYVDDCETYFRMADTICPPMTAKKMYCGAYPNVNTSSGVEIPGANEALMQTLDKGVLAMIYAGHGGITGLTGDRVFTNSDIAALENSDKLPFVFTATCEFSKYDDPLVISAGERMFLNPHGGSVAMLTTSRSTYGGNNVRLGKALMKTMFQREADGKPLRFGDIVRMAKIDPSNYTSSEVSLNTRFVFFGDPAMRFPLPHRNVAVRKVNGVVVNDTAETLSLHSMSMVSVEGEILKADGSLDSQFNGELWVNFFDKKTKMLVKRYGSNNNGQKNVYYHKDVLYHGCVTVNAGRFNLYFQVPKDIKPEYGTPRFSFYAYDSIRGVDAMGKFDNLSLGGVDPVAVADNEGPRIDFYWNTPNFVNGSSVERQGVLYADLYDAQGIYHYDYSLGRDIVMNSNFSAYNGLILNDSYEPVLNDFRRGRIVIPLTDLKPGTYEFVLKVWDTQDNSSEAKLWFVVGEDLFLSQVFNYPNPFSDETRITMKHFGEDGVFDVNIEIFDLMGRKVNQLSQRVSSTNGVIEPLRWDGRDTYGNPLQTGVYLYRLTMTDETGYSRTVSQRMLIQR